MRKTAGYLNARYSVDTAVNGGTTTLCRPGARYITVAMMVMPSATATETRLLGVLQVSNCTGNFASSVNHRSFKTMAFRRNDDGKNTCRSGWPLSHQPGQVVFIVVK